MTQLALPLPKPLVYGWLPVVNYDWWTKPPSWSWYVLYRERGWEQVKAHGVAAETEAEARDAAEAALAEVRR